MKIHFYGTGASEGFPAMFCDCKWCEEARRLGGKNYRTRTSCQVDEALLIDCSCDSYAHVLFAGLDMRKIKHILFTHSHEDHLYPADLLTILPPMAWRNDRTPLELYGTDGCAKRLEAAMIRRQNVQEDLCVHTLPLWETAEIGTYHITPLQANHDPNETCFVYVIQREEKCMLFGHDSAMFGEETWQALMAFRFDCVVLDCTSVDKPNIFTIHMGFDDNIAIRDRMLKEGMADDQTVFVATHFAHTFGPLHDRLTELFAPEGFIAAWDGMELEF